MKRTLLFFFILGSLFVGRYSSLYECSAAKFEYERIESTIYDNDWHGSTYTVLEMNSFNIWYEDALIQFLPKESELLIDVTDSLERFALDLGFEDYRLIKSGGDHELCLEGISFSIEKMNSGLFENSYDIFIDSDFSYFLPTDEGTLVVDDYGFKLKTQLTTHGLVTPFFIETYLKQLYLYELNKVCLDYFGIGQIGEI